ncbi:hypothetical protein GCM10008111_28040 [Alishewanella tabrizica]|uniref:Uncharacterized protein n=1 Tax=Alishewanella tabrizica TaxID=671278 RepID=A0ABQ2WV95_9ALTE|nr:hypothetical protein GCM10008111_28040 [Alishewanella tabrizica]
MKVYLPMILFVLLLLCLGLFNMLSRWQLGAELRVIDYVIPLMAPFGILFIWFLSTLSRATYRKTNKPYI